MASTGSLTDRRGLWAFMLGVLCVAIGVVVHLQMFLMARTMGYRMVGMPIDEAMVVAMALIVAGVGVAAYGLLPKTLATDPVASKIVVSPPEDAPLSWQHWRLMSVLIVALIIDVMKPASLGFTIPGMVGEYGVAKATVSLVPFFALDAASVSSSIRACRRWMYMSTCVRS